MNSLKKLKITPEKWQINSQKNLVLAQFEKNGKGLTKWVADCENKRTDVKMSEEEIEANAYLIAASQQALSVAIKTYVSILQTPSEEWRAKNQDLYLELRSYIAKATNNSGQHVQEFYEQVAVLMKYHGYTFEKAIQDAVE